MPDAPQVPGSDPQPRPETIAERLRDLEHAITSLADLVVLVDQRQLVVECDGACDRIWGLSAAELLGRPIPTFSGRVTMINRDGTAIPPSRDPISLAIATGEPQRGGVLGIRHADDAVTWTQVLAIPVTDRDGEPRVLSIWTDVSAMVEREADLAGSSIEIERRVEARTAELEATIARLDATVSELEGAVLEAGAFNYSISHDLRAPVRTISVLAETLLAEFGETGSPAARDLISRIRRAALRIDDLIEALLRFSSVTDTEPVRVPIDLSAMAHREVRRLSDEDPDHEVECVVAEGMIGHGDEQLIEIALHNLIANAWKFSARVTRPRIEIGVRPPERTNEGPVYFVRDNGIGLDAQDVDQIFVPFRRLAAASEYEGSGVGLALVHRIVTRHGGRIWVESAPGRGATFCFTLPGTT